MPLFSNGAINVGHKTDYKYYLLCLGRVKELGPESNAKKKGAAANGSEDDGSSPDEISSLSGGRHINNVDLALLCNHSVRIHLKCDFATSLLKRIDIS